MREDEAYLEVAKRYIESCEQHINHGINIQEVIGFKAYHAFESLGGAFNSHYGHLVPSPHPQKINAFVANSRHNRNVNGRNVSVVAILLSSLRNKCLYPKSSSGTFITPEGQLSLTDAKTMVSRVKGILRQIERIV